MLLKNITKGATALIAGLLFGLLLGYGVNAHAQTVTANPPTLTWTAPTARNDKTALPASAIGGYEVRYKLKTDSTYKSVSTIKTTSYTLPNLPSGTYEASVACYDTQGLYSTFASFDAFTIVSPPGPPTNLRITTVK